MAFKVLCVGHVGVAVNDLALIKEADERSAEP